MTTKRQYNRVDSCVLVADVEDSRYSFNVDPKSAQESMQTIKDSYELFNVDCKRVYVSGFILVEPGNNLSKSQLIDRVMYSIEMMSKANNYASVQSAK